jgi:hypothetical protein
MYIFVSGIRHRGEKGEEDEEGEGERLFLLVCRALDLLSLSYRAGSINHI